LAFRCAGTAVEAAALAVLQGSNDGSIAHPGAAGANLGRSGY
jgi:hypothetical protein